MPSDWKVTKKLTVDYGVRYDLLAPFDEMHNRLSEFSATTANPAAGGRLGAVVYEGSGAGPRCRRSRGRSAWSAS